MLCAWWWLFRSGQIHKLLVVPGSDSESVLGRLHPVVTSSFSSTVKQLLLVILQGAFQHRDNLNLRTVKMCHTWWTRIDLLFSC